MSASRIWSAITFCAMLFAMPTLAQTPEAPQQTAGPIEAKPTTAKTLTNASVIRMAEAGLSDELIIQAINTQPGQFTTDGEAMAGLKETGVSERVITAMINKSRKRLVLGGETTEAPPPAPISDTPNEIGVYYKDHKGNWELLQAEVVHTKSGGWLKSTATHGIIKQDTNGHLNGRESKLALQTPVEILVYTAEGSIAADYNFLRFRVHSDNREFRTMTGGVFHSHSGAERDEVDFSPSKIAPRTFTFTIDKKVGGGEFGILPPSTGNVTNGGRIYTFAITE
jgi:hypothetical protein